MVAGMDYMEKELDLLYAAVRATMERSIHTVPPKIYRSEKGFLMHQDFRGDRSDADLENEIHLLIHNIASLRDHLRRYAREGAKGVERVDDTIKRSRDLQIIIDLWNTKKHSKPDRSGGYSRLQPRLENAKATMRLTAKSGHAAFYTAPPGGPQQATPGATRVITTADVVDRSGNRVDDFDAIATRAVDAWKALLTELNR